MRKERTFCRICEPLCPMIATVDDGDRIVKLEPDREHPVSKGFACHKGLSFLQVHDDPDRVNTPLRRTNAKDTLPASFEPISWDAAMADIGTRLRTIRDRHGPDAISVYFSNPVSLNSNAFPLAASLGAQIGSRRNFNAGTQDAANKPAAMAAVFGAMNLFPIPDFANTEYLLCFGGNPKISHWTFTSIHRPLSVLQDIAGRGGKVRFINPRSIESATPGTGEVTLIKPDSDVYLMAAILNEMDRAGRFDEERIVQYSRNIEGLRAFIAHYSPERVSKATGIDAATIRAIAQEYADAPAASVYMATGVNQGRQGTLAYWLLMMMSFLSGNLGRKGGDYYAKGVYPNARAIPDINNTAVRTEFGELEEIAGALPGFALSNLIAQENDPVRALIVLGGNPLLSMPGEAQLREALPKLELMVHIDLFRNATAEYADYILPAADWLERSECNLSANGVQPQPFVQFVEAVVPPRYERRDDWWIISRLQQELGLASALDGTHPDMLARARKIVARQGLTLEEIKSRRGQTALLPLPDWEDLLDTMVFHPAGRVDCCPDRFAEAIERCHRIFTQLCSESEDQLKLISLRTNYMHNSNLANMPALKRGEHALNPLHIHPDDAARLGLAEGDNAKISSGYGCLQAPVRLDATLRLGVVAMSHGYGHERSFGLERARSMPGVNVNSLMPRGTDGYEPLSNMAHLTGVPVKVRSMS